MVATNGSLWTAFQIEQAADLVATDPATFRRAYKKFGPAYLQSVIAALEL